MRTALLCALALSACSFEDEPELGVEVDEAVVIGDTEFECGSGTFSIREGDPERSVAVYRTTVLPDQPRLINAYIWGKQLNTSGDDDILQMTRIDCIGPVRERIATTQNALRGGPSIKTTAHVVLTTPGDYTCTMSTITMHAGAILQIYGDQSCIAAQPLAGGQDWVRDTADQTTVGEGRRVSKGSPAYVLPRTFTFAPTTNHVSLHADIELTDIEGPASGTSIVACEQTPYTDNGSANARLRVAARQVCQTSNCYDAPWPISGRVCPYTFGPTVDVTISAKTHHQKLFAKLDMPVSKASDCQPAFQVRAYVEARDGGNDLCFHAARYSNLWVYPID